MGVSLEFYAGDAEAIGAAITHGQFDGLRRSTLAHAYADLSLHLGADALDTLSEQVAVLTGREEVLLLDSLERSVGGTEGESGAEVVSPEWVEMMAAVPVSSAAELSRKWLEAFAAENEEELETESPDAATAITALIRLCQSALERGTEVVFAWYP